MRLLGLQVPFRNGLGEYFWSSLFDVDVLTAILIIFFNVFTSFNSILEGLRPRKSLIFMELSSKECSEPYINVMKNHCFAHFFVDSSIKINDFWGPESYQNLIKIEFSCNCI